MAGQHPLIWQFMKIALHLFQIWSVVTMWDLQLELNALLHLPFESLDEVDLKILSFKTVLLLALALGNPVTYIQPFLWIWPVCSFLWGILTFSRRLIPLLCLKFSTSHTSSLSCWPFIPLVSPLKSMSCFTSSAGCQAWTSMPVEQLDSGSWNSSLCLGKPVMKQRLSHGRVETIAAAYDSRAL